MTPRRILSVILTASICIFTASYSYGADQEPEVVIPSNAVFPTKEYVKLSIKAQNDENLFYWQENRFLTKNSPRISLNLQGASNVISSGAAWDKVFDFSEFSYDNGKRLNSNKTGLHIYSTGEYYCSNITFNRLESFPADANSLSIVGKLNCEKISKWKTTEIKPLAKNLNKPFPFLFGTITFTNIGSKSVSYKIKYDMEMNIMNFGNEGFILKYLDSSGNEIGRSGQSTNGLNPVSVRTRFRKNLPDDLGARITTPENYEAKQVPFSFADIPIKPGAFRIEEQKLECENFACSFDNTRELRISTNIFCDKPINLELLENRRTAHLLNVKFYKNEKAGGTPVPLSYSSRVRMQDFAFASSSPRDRDLQTKHKLSIKASKDKRYPVGTIDLTLSDFPSNIERLSFTGEFFAKRYSGLTSRTITDFAERLDTKSSLSADASFFVEKKSDKKFHFYFYPTNLKIKSITARSVSGRKIEMQQNFTSYSRESMPVVISFPEDVDLIAPVDFKWYAKTKEVLVPVSVNGIKVPKNIFPENISAHGSNISKDEVDVLPETKVFPHVLYINNGAYNFTQLLDDVHFGNPSFSRSIEICLPERENLHLLKADSGQMNDLPELKITSVTDKNGNELVSCFANSNPRLEIYPHSHYYHKDVDSRLTLLCNFSLSSLPRDMDEIACIKMEAICKRVLTSKSRTFDFNKAKNEDTFLVAGKELIYKGIAGNSVAFKGISPQDFSSRQGVWVTAVDEKGNEFKCVSSVFGKGSCDFRILSDKPENCKLVFHFPVQTKLVKIPLKAVNIPLTYSLMMKRKAPRAAIYKAIEENSLDDLTRLLKVGYRLDRAEHNGMTALQLAARHGRSEMVLPILRAGCPVNYPSKTNMTALDYASLSGNETVCEMIKKYGGLATMTNSENLQDTEVF